MNQFNILSEDVIRGIALKLDLSDINNFCQTSKRFNKAVCKNKNFWILKLVKDFDLNYLDIGKGDPKVYYQKISKYWNWPYGGKDSLLMKEAAEIGSLKLVEFFIDKGADQWELGLRGAAKGGHKELVDYFIKRGAHDWDWAIEGAIENGHLDLVQFFSDLGLKNPEEAIFYAQQENQKEIEKFLVDKYGLD